MIGQTLLHYQILEKVGAGGMGEVYRARDTKLGRDVAIKVLSAEMSSDPERLARFDREARTLATLQHPNIASIYGFENAQGQRFLVMELVDGEDLSERLRRGAVPADEVVELAVQLAEGLAAAHAVGIIHRDLKPANIKVSSEGKLKILDFGLARAYADDQGFESQEHSPTITAMTQAGVILGTAAYMAPEQARGKRVDHRADIWAFGVILFEMLTGERLFEGETVSDTLAGVLRADVPWDQLPKNTTPTVRRLLERCLDRNPARRLQSIAEARIALEDLKAGRSQDVVPPAVAPGGSGFRRERLVWIVAVAALVTAVVATPFLRKPPPDRPLILSTLLPPEGWVFSPASPFAVSPDGRQIAFVAIAGADNEKAPAGSNSIWIRDLASPEPRQLAATDGEAYPFWSPDGRWLGFYANGKLNKIEARGGPVVPLCDATTGRGGTWNESGTIVFQRSWSEGLMKIPAAGGTPEPVTVLNKDRFELAHRWPCFLPDGRHFLFYVVSTTNPSTSEYSGIYLGSLDSKDTQLLLKSESRALIAKGHLLYRSGSTLMASPFNVSSRKITGDPVPVATDIPGGAVSWGGAQFGVSAAGILVHMRGAGAAHTVLNWHDRTGKVLAPVTEPGNYWEPSLSHDGTRLAAAVGQDVGDIWIYDLESGMRTRFTFDPADDRTPIWSPDDHRLAFTSSRGSEGEIYVRPASGQGEATLLFAAKVQAELTDWSADGRLIFFNRLDPGENGYDIWAFNTETSEAAAVLEGKLHQKDASLSPDGKWLAFVSDESGAHEVYVQSFPEGQGRWMISSDDVPSPAIRPKWRGDGRELFYMKGGTVLAVPVAGTATFTFGSPHALFSVNVTPSSVEFMVAKDGQRIMTNDLPPVALGSLGAAMIQNWEIALGR